LQTLRSLSLQPRFAYLPACSPAYLPACPGCELLSARLCKVESMEHGAKSLAVATWPFLFHHMARSSPRTGDTLSDFFWGALVPAVSAPDLASSLIDCCIEDFIWQYDFDEIGCRVEYYCPGFHLPERCRGLVSIKRAPSGDGWTPSPNPAIKFNSDIACRHAWLWWLTGEPLRCRERLANKTKIASPFA
jgi:hypothetical protein